MQVDDDFEYILSDDLGMDQNKAKQVLNFLLSRSLFDNTRFSVGQGLDLCRNTAEISACHQGTGKEESHNSRKVLDFK